MKLSSHACVDVALLVKVIRFALQAGARLTCFFSPLNGRIAEKYDGSQEFICRLFRPERVLLNRLPIFGMLSRPSLAFGHRAPSNTMR
jgi:hypothetical protein